MLNFGKSIQALINFCNYQFWFIGFCEFHCAFLNSCQISPKASTQLFDFHELLLKPVVGLLLLIVFLHVINILQHHFFFHIFTILLKIINPLVSLHMIFKMDLFLRFIFSDKFVVIYYLNKCYQTFLLVIVNV